jgi:hypothetical protein
VTVRTLSKSKLVAFRQCAKRLWLEVHRPGLAEVSSRSAAIFRTGHQVGDIARALYDPADEGALIDLQGDGVRVALEKTQALLQARKPVFEPGFSAVGGLAFADVLLPVGQDAWRMVEVKASTSVKDYQREDVAIQSYIARAAGLQLVAASVAHIDSTWTYPGGGDYRGLLCEVDLTDEAVLQADDVGSWLVQAHAVVAQEAPPEIVPSGHCTRPFECAFARHCNDGRPRAEYPVEWLPRIQSKALKKHIAEHAVTDMRGVPEELLTALQSRVRECTVSGTAFFDTDGARAELALHSLPALFLDFETIAFAVPVWAGTRPFQQIPFQFSVHRLEKAGALAQEEFLDLSGRDPSRGFAERLVACCGTSEPVFVYNAGFEGARIRELAERFPDLAEPLWAIGARLVDLWPITVRRFYDPRQQGSWSIKHVLPAVAPDLRHDALDGVTDGAMAQEAFLEATQPGTTPERRDALRSQLLAYCRLDTLAMVKLWEVLSGGRTLA